MRLEGVFLCVRCGAELTELKIVREEGAVCEDEATCQLIRNCEVSSQ
jgi:DNA-directed RNA polymerase subunit RPC12/RpoP